jgi:polar amino acid transport system substrate-binding protein
MIRFLLSLVAVLMSGCATSPDATSLERHELAPTGVLRVAVFTGNPVIGSPDPVLGEPKGTTALLGKELAAQAGVLARVIEYTSVAKLVEDAKAGAWDVAVVAYDPARLGVLEFAPPHMVVDLTFLVAPGSRIRDVAEVDQTGVSVAAARGAATTLYLERTLKQAKVVPAANEPAAFALIREGRAQAYAQNRYMLLGLADQLPGARVLDDHFSVAEMCLVLPKGRTAARNYVAGFVLRAKSQGTVARAIAESGLRGVSVAP